MSLKRIRTFIMIFTIGSIYFLIEGVWRGAQSWPSLIAKVSLWMLLIGGVSGVINGRINKTNFIRKHFDVLKTSKERSVYGKERPPIGPLGNDIRSQTGFVNGKRIF